MPRYNHHDVDWVIPDEKSISWEQVQVALLMDIRSLLRVLRCPEFTGIPGTLKGIRRKLPGRPPRVDAGRRHRRLTRGRRW